LRTIFQTGVSLLAYLLNAPSQEIVMVSASNAKARCIGAASFISALSCAGTSLASQGPGTSMGTASPFTQLAMAVLVYGLSALVVGAGLIGAVRRH
jgi:hypothetical protein